MASSTLLSAIFHGLTWSVREGAMVEVRLGDEHLCIVDRGVLRSGGVEVSLEDVVTRSNTLLADGGADRRPPPVFNIKKL